MKSASPHDEVEIKFPISDLHTIAQALPAAGFRLKTNRTHEMNTLYDTSDGALRLRGETLRIRKFGDRWTLTHKSKGTTGPHKSRKETETTVEDGTKLDSVFNLLGFTPFFRYEKYRSEWTDGTGDVVLDETPIGDYGEIEGPPAWIDNVAKKLAVSPAAYNTKSYLELFAEWKQKHASNALEMTWQALK